MTVGLRNPTIFVVDHKFRSLVLTNFPSAINRGGLVIGMRSGATCATGFYIPSALRRWSYVD